MCCSFSGAAVIFFPRLGQYQRYTTEKKNSLKKSYMSRPVRIEFPGASYHVTSKSRDGQIIFIDDDDRGAFLNVVENVVDRFEWLVHSYGLLGDRYDLVVEVPGANLSKGMRQLNGVYTQHFNRRHGLEGPIFHGRFKSVLFEKKTYLLPVCRHVVTSPTRGEESTSYSSYKWSSYRALAGQVKKPKMLHGSDVLSHFGKREKDAQRKYREYIKEGVKAESPLENRTNQVLLGSPK